MNHRSIFTRSLIARSRAQLFAFVASCMVISALTATGILFGGRAVEARMSPDSTWTPFGMAAGPASPLQDSQAAAALADSLAGHSGRLRFRLIESPSTTLASARSFVSGSPLAGAFHWIPLLPFESKKKDRIGSYRLGYWPAELRPVHSEAYDNPAGFIEVTPQNQGTFVSPHFRLADFLTHNQDGVWPKYLVLREALIDKLELVVADLEQHGIPVRDINVMSGFRTPAYNALGVGKKGGRARDSRHQFGDAADVYIDNNGDGRMDDLNQDGRVNVKDARVVIQAVDRVEREYPDLIGGAGLYASTRGHGPFVHIDARGQRARWGGA